MNDEYARRTVLNLLGLSSVGLTVVGVSAAKKSSENKDKREKVNKKTKEKIEKNRWVKQNKNIYWKYIATSSEKIYKNEFEGVPGLKISKTEGDGYRIKANLNKLPFRKEDAKKDIQK